MSDVKTFSVMKAISKFEKIFSLKSQIRLHLWRH